MVRGLQGHEGIRAESVAGPSGGGMGVTQCCTWAAKCAQLVLFLQCEVRGQGMYASCTREWWTERHSGVGRDYVPCAMNILTAGMMLTVAVTYVPECTQCT
jgi:hypothetical protein